MVTEPAPKSDKRWAVFVVITGTAAAGELETVVDYASHTIIDKMEDWELKYFTPEHGFLVVPLPDVGGPAAGWVAELDSLDVDRKLANQQALLGMSKKELAALPPRKESNSEG